jgi:UDP-N-acetyl-2-amino-2-deoxyglucuronate dehydrogenase
VTPPLRVGLVGGGGISETHARAALAAGLEVAAVQGVNAEKVRAICARHGGRPCTDLDSLLQHRPLDLVAIGSPSALHAEQGIAAARAGLHVLVEKPIDVTTDKADALVGAAEAAGVTLGVFFQDRFKPDIVRLKDAVDAGILGKPILADARVPWYRPPEYYSASRWRGTPSLDGGGALINQAIHTLDVLIWVLGDVARVRAKTATLLHRIDVEDCGAAILEFASGVLGLFGFTTAAYPGYARRLSITGDRGTVAIEQDSIVAWDLRDTAGTPPPASVATPSEAASSPVVSDVGPHAAVFADFVEAIRERRAPRCGGRDARRSVAVVQAIYEASRTDRIVDVR